MSYHVGTKTTSPTSPRVEKPGEITSDSLAAESLAANGSFGSNTTATASLQPSSSTTANNTDISGATTLPSAPDAEARQAQEDWSEAAQLKAGEGLGAAYDTSTGSGANTGAAPGAYTKVQESLPKGRDLKEGGFDSEGPNASFNGEVGGRKDPGREAIGEFQRKNAGDDGGKRQGQVGDEGAFDALGGDASA